MNRGNFAFDDLVAIVRNSDVTNTTRPLLESIRIIRNNDFWGNKLTSPSSHKSYRPLVTFMFNLEYRLFKDEAMASQMKWLNFWIHCGVSCFLMEVLKRMLGNVDEQVVFLTSLLFAVHPIHTEAVAGIVGRADLMCGFFYLLTIWTYLKFVKINDQIDKMQIFFWLKLLFSLAFMATLSKELGITVLVSIT